MDQNEVLYTFKRVGVLSKKDGKPSFDITRIHSLTTELSSFCEAIADSFLQCKVEAVVSSNKGLWMLAHLTAHYLHLSSGVDVCAFYAKRVLGNTTVRDGGAIYKRLSGQKTLVVHDVVSPAETIFINSVIDSVQEAGGILVGLGAICSYGKVTRADIGAKLVTLAKI
jgi:orotate phosphoribosyltransferase